MPLSRTLMVRASGIPQHVDVQVRVLALQRGIGQGLEAQLVAGVGGVGDQLAQEDLLVRVQRVRDQVKHLGDFGFELAGLGGVRVHAASGSGTMHGRRFGAGNPLPGAACRLDRGTGAHFQVRRWHHAAMDYRGRFAPSPTGDLHGGSLVAALGSWLRARQAGGRWLVRMDDLDPPREVPGSADAILAALRVYGLVPDEPVLYQSRRDAAYQAGLRSTAESQAEVFPCWCSRSDLAAHDGLHRDGRCVTPPRDDRPPGLAPARAGRSIAFDDALQGPQDRTCAESVGDFVLRRADGVLVLPPGLRGRRCLPGRHRGGARLRPARFHAAADPPAADAWGCPRPAYLHLPLALRTDASGKLSKCTRDLPLDRTDPVARPAPGAAFPRPARRTARRRRGGPAGSRRRPLRSAPDSAHRQPGALAAAPD